MAIDVVRVAAWERYGWLRHGFSTRAGGVSIAYGAAALNLGFTVEDDRAHVIRNRDDFVREAAGAGPWRLSTVRQVHSGGVVSAGDELVDADGMVTANAGVLAGILTADCVPVLIADIRRKVVGAFHAGWRGTAAGIVGHGVARMRDEFGSKPEDLVGAVGPAIGPCCYVVGEALREEFAGDLFMGRHLDLWEANRRQLVAAGIAADCVTVIGECTACARDQTGARRYFSHRAEQGHIGRMMSLIGIALEG